MTASEFLERAFRWAMGTLWCAAIGLGGNLLLAQPRIIVNSLIEPNKRLAVYVVPSSCSAIELKEDEFDQYQLAIPNTPSPFSLCFMCDESLLIPETQRRCYLHLFLFKTQDRPSKGSIPGWYEKDRITVIGTFMDQPIQLKVKIVDNNETYESLLPLAVHQKVPQNALESEFVLTKLDISTGKKSRHSLRFANRTECDINIFPAEARLEGSDNKLWFPFEPMAAASRKIPPTTDNKYFDGLEITLQPRSYAAFWKSVWPYSEKTPHELLKLTVPFQVEGGYRAEITRDLAVEFKPRPPWLLLFVIIGALVSAIISFLAAPGQTEKSKEPGGPTQIGGAKGPASSTPRADPTGGEAAKPTGSVAAFQESSSQKPTRASKPIRIPLKSILLRVALACIVFLIYMIIKGRSQVVIFNLELDPTQLLPAFLIGFFVGIRPVFLLNKLLRIVGLDTNVGVALITASIGLSGLVNTASGMGGPPFRPLTLSYHAPSNSLYSLHVEGNSGSIYKLNCDSPKLQFVRRLDPSLNPVDSCLVDYEKSLWLAVIGQRAVGLTKTTAQRQTASSISTVSLVPLDGNSPRNAEMRAGIEAWRCGYSGVTYDIARQRLLIIDCTRASIYAIGIAPGGLEQKEELVFTDARLSSPSRIVVYGAEILIGDNVKNRIYRVDPSKKVMTQLEKQFEEIAGLAFFNARNWLFVADAGKPAVLAYDLLTSELRQTLILIDLKEPRAVAIDRNSRIWVADPGAHAILCFSRDGGLLGRYSPTK